MQFSSSQGFALGGWDNWPQPNSPWPTERRRQIYDSIVKDSERIILRSLGKGRSRDQGTIKPGIKGIYRVKH